MLPRFVKAFLPRRKCLLISWLHSLSAGPSSLFLSAPCCKTLIKERTGKMTDYISDGCFVLFSEMWPLSSELENSVLFWFFFCGFGEEPHYHWSSRQGQIWRIRLDGEGQGHPGGACGWGLPWIAQGLCLLPWLTQVKAYDLEVPLTIQHHLLAPGGLESLSFFSQSLSKLYSWAAPDLSPNVYHWSLETGEPACTWF